MQRKVMTQKRCQCVIFWWTGFICFFVCAGSFAQPAVEEVVFITDSVGYEIDKAEEERYGLFPEYHGFILAEFLRREGGYVLQISYEKEGRRLTERIALSGDEFEAYRNRIEAMDAAMGDRKQRVTTTEAQREGRVRIVVDAVLYGLWLYGPGTIILFDLEDIQASGLELLIAGGCFVAALNGTSDYRLGYGRSKLIRWGSYAGTLYGAGIPVFFESENEKAYMGSAMLFTPLGGLLAYKLSSHRWFEKGEADLIANGGLAGGLYGVAIPYLINIGDMEDRTQGKIYTASAMLGIPTGILGTTRLIRGKTISQGQAHLIIFGGTMGSSYGVGLLNLAGVDAGEHPRGYVLSAALALPIGAYLGYRFTAGEEYTLGRAWLISIGTYAGALLGSGFAMMVRMEEERKLYVLATMLGSAAGMYYTNSATRGWGKKISSAITGRISLPDRVSVSLPSYGHVLCMGLLAIGKPPPGEDRCMEVLRVSF